MVIFSGIVTDYGLQRDACRYLEGEFSLTGVWYNDHGSELILCHGDDGKLTGEYRTTVETRDGSAGMPV